MLGGGSGDWGRAAGWITSSSWAGPPGEGSGVCLKPFGKRQATPRKKIWMKTGGEELSPILDLSTGAEIHLVLTRVNDLERVIEKELSQY